MIKYLSPTVEAPCVGTFRVDAHSKLWVSRRLQNNTTTFLSGTPSKQQKSISQECKELSLKVRESEREREREMMYFISLAAPE